MGWVATRCSIKRFLLWMGLRAALNDCIYTHEDEVHFHHLVMSEALRGLLHNTLMTTSEICEILGSIKSYYA